MPLFTRRDREAVGTAGTALALVALPFGFTAVVVAAHADNRKIADTAGAVQVSLSELAISPSTIAVPLDGRLHVTNSGTAVHNFDVAGTKVGTRDLQPGDSTVLHLTGG